MTQGAEIPSPWRGSPRLTGLRARSAREAAPSPVECLAKLPKNPAALGAGGIVFELLRKGRHLLRRAEQLEGCATAFAGLAIGWVVVTWAGLAVR
jgi:hypothetical protein